MRNISHKLRPYVRSCWRLWNTLLGFFYDFKRVIYYGGWRGNSNDLTQRNYQLAMQYHGLEKSMSYKTRKKDSGWSKVPTVLHLIKIASNSGDIGFHDRAAKIVLKNFIDLPENRNTEKGLLIKEELEKINFDSADCHGTREYGINEFNKGILKNPEEFFFSRYSLREFSQDIVDETLIKRAVTLAMKSPSVCNRQEWHVYHTSNSELKEKALRYQAGNQGFGHKIPNLMIITTDLEAFFSGKEHYQHWIDGGIFSMSLIYALHSLGIASCCLNWSQSPKNDQLLRSVVDIKQNHTVIMMLAVGRPNVENKVCVSARRPIQEVYSPLKDKT